MGKFDVSSLVKEHSDQVAKNISIESVNFWYDDTLIVLIYSQDAKLSSRMQFTSLTAISVRPG